MWAFRFFRHGDNTEFPIITPPPKIENTKETDKTEFPTPNKRPQTVCSVRLEV